MSEDMDLSQESSDSQTTEDSGYDYSGEVETPTEESTESTEESVSEESAELTPKGTKVDPDPKSAIHQELANERRMREQYQRVLSDPDAFAKYAQQAGFTKAEAKQIQKEAEDAFNPDSFKSAADIAQAMNSLKQELSAYKQESERLQTHVGSIEQVREQEVLYTSLSSEINSVRDEYPELNPNAPEYDADLEKDVTDAFQEKGIDPTTGKLIKGASLKSEAKRLVSIARRARGTGSKDAQTRVVQKTAGKVITNKKSGNSQTPESGLTAEQVIAQRMKKMWG